MNGGSGRGDTGGKILPAMPQANSETDIDELFAEALAVVRDVMREGARTHPANDWTQREVSHHVRRAQLHLSMWRNGDPASCEDHLSHALARLLMAVELRERERQS